VRRGSISSVRYRRAMMPLPSAGGNTVPVIAQIEAHFGPLRGSSV
jgi:hypothetical protein